jgi:hypothetical protein
MQYSIYLESGPVSEPRLFPYRIDADGDVLDQDMWQGDPAGLLGFQATREEQRVKLLFREFTENPQAAVGMYPVFVKQGGGLYNMTRPISEVLVFGGEDS